VPGSSKQPSSAGPARAIFALGRPAPNLARLNDIKASITLVQVDLGDRAELDAGWRRRPEVCFHFACTRYRSHLQQQ